LLEVRNDPAFESRADGHDLRAVIGSRTPLRGRRLAAGVVGGVGLGAYWLLARGSLTVDLGLGRSIPLTWRIDAPRDLVFDLISAPYLGRTTRALQTKLRVLERGADLVLAEHYTRVGPILTTTVETVRFEPPHSVYFRLVRGPVPLVLERFELHEAGGGTTLEYTGRLGTDLWGLGRWWGARVGARWEAAVQGSLDAVQAEAERASRLRSQR
jgi:hypothetical protein